MRWLYRLSIECYVYAIKLASPFNAKAREWVTGRQQQALDLDQRLRAVSGAVWAHCASLGEFEQVRPVLEELRASHPYQPIVVSFFSPSGYRVRHNWSGADDVFYLPADRVKAANAWLDALNPTLVIWVKYEFWFNFMAAIERRSIPCLLISAAFRSNQHFFKPYGNWFARQLKRFTAIFTQTTESQQLLNSVGIDAIVAGDTRFDRVTAAAQQSAPIPLIETFTAHAMTVIAGSSWPHEEGFLERYMTEQGYAQDLRLIVVPHEVNERHIARIESRFKDHCLRYSHAKSNPSVLRPNRPDGRPHSVLIIDEVGLLATLYRYAQVAVIGGGFGSGIHNTLEAAVYGIPVVFGPRHQKFNEARSLIEEGAGFSVNNYREFQHVMSTLTDTSDDSLRKKAGAAASRYVQKSTGATSMIIRAVSAQLNP